VNKCYVYGCYLTVVDVRVSTGIIVTMDTATTSDATAGATSDLRSGSRSGSARQRYPRGQGDRLRQDLLDAAAELMATHGDIDAISLRSVARRAGVSATAVYRHFDNHLDLLGESVEDCWRQFGDSLVEAMQSSSDPFVAFRAAGDAYVRFAMDHPGQYRVLFSNKVVVPFAHPEIGENSFQLLVDNVSAMLDELGDDRDPWFVAAQVHTWIHGIVDLCGSHPDMRWPDTSQLLDGLQDALGLHRPT
jgi:AcrR family transcriptional regulator